MALSDKCIMKGKWSLTTMLLNNLDLWIPALLCADLTQEQRNLGLVLRQGGCWSSSTSGWFSGSPRYTFTLFPHAEEIFPKHHKQNGQHTISWTLVNRTMSVSVKSASLCLCWCPYFGEEIMIYCIRRKHFFKKKISKITVLSTALNSQSHLFWQCRGLAMLHETPYVSRVYVLFAWEQQAYLPGDLFW